MKQTRSDYSEEVKLLYDNRLMIEEVFTQMTASIKKIVNSNEPLKVYEEENDKI